MPDPHITHCLQTVRKLIEGELRPCAGEVEHDQAVLELGETLENMYRHLEHHDQEQQALARVVEQINAGLTLDEVLDLIYTSFREIIPYDRMGFAQLESDGYTVRSHWARAEIPEIHLSVGYEVDLRGHSLETILKTGQPRIINNLPAHLEEHPSSEPTRLVVAEGIRSSLTCPVIANGKPIGFLFFSSLQPNTYEEEHTHLYRQIAGQVSMTVEKSRMYQRLLQLDQQKNRFLGITAHDLRTPITVVKGMAGIILAETVGNINKRQRTLVEKVNTACDKMLSMINDLLDVRAIQSGQFDLDLQTTNLNNLLEEAAENSTLLAGAKQIDLSAEVPENLGDVCIDRNRIMQVLDNLVTNAIKFSYPKTRITMAARREGDNVWISIADQGQGIPTNEQSNIFTEFARTSIRPTGGEKSTGLGLAIVQRLVKAHDGEITLKSKPGEGSTFTFRLPVGSCPVPESNPKRSAE